MSRGRVEQPRATEVVGNNRKGHRTAPQHPDTTTLAPSVDPLALFVDPTCVSLAAWMVVRISDDDAAPPSTVGKRFTEAAQDLSFRPYRADLDADRYAVRQDTRKNHARFNQGGTREEEAEATK